jgi:hypothetical protein
MATFEQIIRKDLMDAVHAAMPALTLDAKGEPDTARVLLVERDFAYDNPRQYRLRGLAEGYDAPHTIVAKVTTDVTVTAMLEIHGVQRADLEALFEALLSATSILANWRGYEVRIGRTLRSTKIGKLDNGVQRELVLVEYTAPYFSVTDVPQIAAASWFDGWKWTIGEEE